MKAHSRIHTAVLPLLAALAVACGGGRDPEPETPAPSLTISPTEWSVLAGGAAKQFTATLTGASGALAWSIETAGTAAEVGSISGDGTYTPPAALAVGRDVVVKVTAGTLVAKATVHVGAAVDGVTLSVSPATGAVVAGSTDSVTLTADTTYSGTVTWELAPALGALDATTGMTVVYDAPAGLVTADTDVVVTATAGVLIDSTTITVHPTVLVVTGPATVRAGGSAVSFTLATDPEGNAVVWSVSPAAAGSVTGSGTTGTFTPAVGAAAETPFEVTATIGGATGSASATLLPPAASVNVAGRVIDQQGAGFAGATVIVGNESTTSAADGSFTFSAVATPYDLTVISVDAGSTEVQVFRGATMAAPLVDVYKGYTSRSTTLSGKVTAGGSPAASVAVVAGLSSTTSNSSGDYTGLLAIWGGPASTSLVVRAVDVDRNADLTPAAYAFGSRTSAVTSDVPLTGQDLSIAPVTAGAVTGTRTYEDDYDPTMCGLGLVATFADGVAVTLFSERLYGLELDTFAPGQTFSLLSPALEGAQVRVSYGCIGFGGWDGGSGTASAPVTPGQTGIALVMPPLPQPSAPAEAAAGVGNGTDFTWNNANTGGLNELDVDCGLTTYHIHGGSPSARIPDLSTHGVTVAVGEACTWSPAWRSVSVDEHLQGEAASDALPLRRSSDGPTRSFTF